MILMNRKPPMWSESAKTEREGGDGTFLRCSVFGLNLPIYTGVVFEVTPTCGGKGTMLREKKPSATGGFKPYRPARFLLFLLETSNLWYLWDEKHTKNRFSSPKNLKNLV